MIETVAIFSLRRTREIYEIVVIWLLGTAKERRFCVFVTLTLLLLMVLLLHHHIILPSIWFQVFHWAIFGHSFRGIIVIKVVLLETSGNSWLHFQSLFVARLWFEQRYSILNLFLYKIWTICFRIRIQIIVRISIFLLFRLDRYLLFIVQAIFRFTKYILQIEQNAQVLDVTIWLRGFAWDQNMYQLDQFQLLAILNE